MVLRIGGSLLTRKGQLCTMATDRVNALAHEVAAHGSPLLIVHGLGSFGHGYLPMYPSGVIPPADLALARRVRDGLREVSQRLQEGLIEVGVVSIGLDPASVMIVRNRMVEIVDVQIILEYLHSGMTVTVHGGLLPDVALGHSVISSDVVASQLARAVKARTIIWATDVPGVWRDTRDGQRVMPVLTSHNVGDMAHQHSDEANITGGMAGKVNVALDLAAQGIPSIIVSGLSPGVVSAAMRGDEVLGTRVEVASE